MGTLVRGVALLLLAGILGYMWKETQLSAQERPRFWRRMSVEHDANVRNEHE